MELVYLQLENSAQAEDDITNGKRNFCVCSVYIEVNGELFNARIHELVSIVTVGRMMKVYRYSRDIGHKLKKVTLEQLYATVLPNGRCETISLDKFTAYRSEFMQLVTPHLVESKLRPELDNRFLKYTEENQVSARVSIANLCNVEPTADQVKRYERIGAQLPQVILSERFDLYYCTVDPKDTYLGFELCLGDRSYQSFEDAIPRAIKGRNEIELIDQNEYEKLRSFSVNTFNWRTL